MIWKRRYRITVIGGLLVLAVPVDAQVRSTAEISSGYQIRHAANSGFVPRGWFVSGGPYVTDVIAVIGEVARNHGARAVADVPGIGPDASGDDTTYMGGILWRRPARSVTVFMRLLVGARRLAVHRDMTEGAAGWATVGAAIQGRRRRRHPLHGTIRSSSCRHVLAASRRRGRRTRCTVGRRDGLQIRPLIRSRRFMTRTLTFRRPSSGAGIRRGPCQ